MLSDDSSLSDLDRLVLTQYPYPIAVAYRRMLAAGDWDTRIDRALRVFEFLVRATALGLVSEYVTRDAEDLKDEKLNQLLIDRFRRATLGTWLDMLFTSLHAYRERPDLLFVSELHDLYGGQPRRARRSIRQPYDRLVEIRNELVHRFKPTTDEEWQVLGEEVLRLLREVLGHFSFLQYYDLLRLVAEEHGRLTCLLFKGEHVRETTSDGPPGVQLSLGWFYLRNARGELLQLHPLFIFWQGEAEGLPADPTGRADAALFESLSRSVATYLAVAFQQVVTERMPQDSAIQALQAAINAFRQSQRVFDRFTWETLQRVGDAISVANLGDVVIQFNPDLYLERVSVRESFADFLASDSLLYLVLGNSGSGKSSFLASLAHDYRDHPAACLLLYSAPKLDDPATPLAQAIGESLENQLRLMFDLGPGRQIEDFMLELARIEGIQSRQVILAIDALNEHPRPQELLTSIMRLADRWPARWLKIVLTSRPEAWRSIRRVPQMRDQRHRFYQPPDRPGPADDDPYDVPAIEMEPFSWEELPLIYERYRADRRVQTPFAALTTEVKELLRDPLALRLVTSSYAGAEIPRRVHPSEIYDLYVQQLMRDGRLDRDDRRFLEEDLVPRMASPGAYLRAIPPEEVQRATLPTGQRLIELVYSTELAAGTPIAHSFIRLVDAQILTPLGDEDDPEISFRYERFYEHFVGRRLVRLARESGDKPGDKLAFYRGLFAQMRESPYLWGPVRSALLEELKRGERALAVALAADEHGELGWVLAAALEEFGRIDPEAIRELLRELLAAPDRAGRPGASGTGSEQRAKINPAKGLAVGVAAVLGVTEILQNAALDRDAAVRALSVKRLYYLSNTQLRVPLEVVTQLSGRTKGWGPVPDKRAFESFAALSALLYMRAPDDPEQSGALGPAWRTVVTEHLLVARARHGLAGVAALAVTNAILEVVIRLFTGIARLLEATGYVMFNMDELRLSFKDRDRGGPMSKRAVYSTVLRLLLEPGPPLTESEDVLLAAVDANDLLTMWLVVLVIASRQAQQEDGVIELTDRLLEQAMHGHRTRGGPNNYVAALLVATGVGLSGGDTFARGERPAFFDELWAVYEHWVAEWWRWARNECWGEKHRTYWMEQCHYVYWLHERYGTTDSYVLEEMHADIERDVERAKDPKKWAYLGDLLWQVADMNCRYGFRAEMARYLLKYKAHDSPIVRDKVVDGLARMASFFGQPVYDCLVQEGESGALLERVRAMEPEETVYHSIGRSAFLFWRNHIALDPKPQVMRHIARIFAHVQHVNSAERWLTDLARYVANAAYGELLFELPCRCSDVAGPEAQPA